MGRALPGTPLIERVMHRVAKRDPDECWPWVGAIHPVNSYGTFSERVGGQVVSHKAHRLVYELLVGPIPAGLHIDHTCHVAPCSGGPTCLHRRCVNPAHLEPVTPLVNVQRVPCENRRSGHGAETHCPQGHPYDDENTYRWNGRRYCIVCRDKRNAERSRAVAA